MNSKKKTVLRGALFGAAVGASMLFFFGEGWGMALHLSFEGVIIGALFGGFAGWLMSRR